MKKDNAIIERRYKFNVISHRSIIKKRINIIDNNENNDDDDQKTYKFNSRKRKNKIKNNLRKQFTHSLKKKIVKTNIRVEINGIIESIIAFDIKAIFKRRKILRKGDAKVITRYNSIDSKLYIDLIHHIIERFIFELLFNYYFKNKSLFKLKPLIFDRINQINQIKFD